MKKVTYKFEVFEINCCINCPMCQELIEREFTCGILKKEIWPYYESGGKLPNCPLTIV